MSHALTLRFLQIIWRQAATGHFSNESEVIRHSRLLEGLARGASTPMTAARKNGFAKKHWRWQHWRDDWERTLASNEMELRRYVGNTFHSRC